MPMRAGRQATWLVALLAAGSLYSSGEDRLRCDEGAAGLASLSPSARMASLQARSERLLAAGQSECAIDALRRALEIDPGSLETRRGLARALLSHGRYQAAISHLERLRRENPVEGETMLLLGRAFSENGSTDSAIDVLSALVKREPSSFVGRFNLATAFAQAERFEEASAEFGRALELAPGHHGARLAAAKCEMNLGNHARALDLVGAWGESTPAGVDQFEVAYIRGLAFKGTGSLTQAEAALRQAVTANPGHADARRELGTLLAGSRNLDEAALHLKRARDLEPGSQETWFALLSVLREVGDQEALQAETALMEQRRKQSQQEDLANRAATRAGRYLERGDAKSALREYRQALAYRPGVAKYHYGEALAHARLGGEQERIASLKKALELDPRNARALTELGAAYTEASRFSEAESVLTAAIDADPQLASASNNLGVLFVQADRQLEAEQMFRRAIEDDPLYVHAYVNLAVSLATQGHLDDALAAIETASGIEPTSPLVNRARTMIERARHGQQSGP